MWVLAYDRPVEPLFFVIVVILQVARFWVLATLGRRWTIRIIVVPSEKLVAKIREFVEGKGGKFLVGIQARDEAMAEYLKANEIPFVSLDGAAFNTATTPLVFSNLSDGSHTFAVEVRFCDDESLVLPPISRVVDLGQNQLTVYGMPIKLIDVPFPRAGMYEARLLCDGEVIAREPILLRESRCSSDATTSRRMSGASSS